MRRKISLLLAVLMIMNLLYASTGISVLGASSPAWSVASPVVAKITDFSSNKNTDWSIAGVNSAKYVYDGTAVKTKYDESNYLSVTKNADTTSNQRADIRVILNQKAVAGEVDFTADKTAGNTDIAFKLNINLQDSAVADLETTLVSVSKNNIELPGGKFTPVTNGSWYRARYHINKTDMKVIVSVYHLNADGTVGDLLLSSDPVALKVSNGTTTLSSDWSIKRYTVEMYGAANVSVGFDNFVLYDGPVNTASFQVGQGGSVVMGTNSILSTHKGIAKEVAVATGETLSFSVVPESGYQVEKVMVGDTDVTSQFTGTSAVSVGKLTANTQIQVSFKTDAVAAPGISNGSVTGNAVLGGEVSVQYDFTDANGDQEDLSKLSVTWERSTDGETGWTTVKTAPTYQITQDDVKSYLRAVIKAYADKAPFESNQISTASIGPISGSTHAISSPAWRIAPVSKLIDFDTDSAGWSKAGAYSSTMTYNHQAVKDTADNSKYLEMTRTSGAAGQRADLRVSIAEQTAVAYDFDFKVKGAYGDTQYLGIITMNFTDGVTTPAETNLIKIKATSIMEATSIHSNAWYRVRVNLNKDQSTPTFDYEIFELDSQGKLAGSIYNRQNIALNLTGLTKNWYLNRFTVEMYGAPESLIAFDNFVAYTQKINTATFRVQTGGKVVIGDNEITSTDKGVASEVAVSVLEALSFGIVPETGYGVRQVLINGIDRTDLFEDGKDADIGKLEENIEIDVTFQNDQPVAPVISNAVLKGLGVIGADLTLSYDYVDANYDKEDVDGAVISWERSADGQTGWTKVANASGRTYLLQEADNNHFIRAIVKAKADKEPFYSNELTTAPYAVGSKNFYVATDGNDSNEGSIEKPFATITGARDAIRAQRAAGTLSSGNIVVNIRGGVYPVTNQIAFDQRDSGVDKSPVVYQAYGNEKVIFEGGKQIDPSKAVKVTDNAILDRLLDSSVKDKLMMINLGAEGIDVPAMIDYGHALNSGWRPHEVYINGTPLEKSVWPNPDSEFGKFIRTTSSVLNGTENTKGPFTIGYPDQENHTKLWSEEAVKNLMIGGFLSNDFSCQHMQVASLSANDKKLVTKGGCNYAPAADRRFYFWNLIEEIDRPGESYIDREKDIIYFYPTTNMETAEIVVSTLNSKMLVVNQASNITFRNLGFEFTRETVVDATGDNLTFDGCTIAHSSGKGIIISGTGNTISNNNIYDCGYGGIDISGGDRTSLVSSKNVIHNNRIHDVGRVKETYSPAINVAGMNVTMTHNELYNNASQVIGMTGNDHLIAYNNIYNGVSESADQGAIYWGRNATELGIRIMYNYFHDMENDYGGYGHQAVFWDDAAYGPYIYGNVFFRSSNTKSTGNAARTNAIKTNGGAYSYTKNNIFIDGANAANYHKWNTGTKAYGWWLWMYDKFDLRFNTVYEKMSALPVTGDTWVNHYKTYTWTDENGKTFSTDLWSHLSNVFKQSYYDAMAGKDRFNDKDWIYAYAQQNAPDYNNLFEGNVCVEIGNVLFGNSGQVTEKNTYTTTNHKIFKDYGTDFTLTEAGMSSIKAKIPDFENVPFDQMGLTSAVGGTAPVISKATIVGESGTGDTVVSNYAFYDADGEKEGISKFEWYISDTENGTYQKLGCNDYQLLIKEPYKNKYVKYSVIPVDQSGLVGELVWSDPICVGKSMGAGETLKTYIQQMEQLLAGRTVGEQFGNVPAQYAKDLSDAITAAKAIDLDDVDAVYAALQRLSKAENEFVNHIITALPNPIQSAGNYEVIPSMGDLNFEVASGVFGVTVTLPTGEALQEIKASGTIMVDGKAVATTLTIPKGTVITASSEASQVTIRLFGDDSMPSQTVALAQEEKTTAIHVCDDTITLSNPAVYQFDGVEKTKATGALTSKFISIATSIDSAGDLGTRTYARLNQTSGFGIVAKELKELLIYTKKAVVSPSPSPVIDPPPANPIGGGSTSSSGSIPPGIRNPETSETIENPFTDITNHWAKNDILEMYRKGIVSGVMPNIFEPDRSITRAEFAALMVRALKLTNEGKLTFTDVEPDAWYAKSVNIAANAQLIAGYGGMFRPEDTITREEMAVVIGKGYLSLGVQSDQGTIQKFKDDEQISEWARDWVDLAATTGLISGMNDGRFAPQENATRAQTASLLKRLLDK